MSEGDPSQVQVSTAPSLNILSTKDLPSTTVRRPQTRSHYVAIKTTRAISMVGLGLTFVVLGMAAAGLVFALQEGNNLRLSNNRQDGKTANLNSTIQLEAVLRTAAIESEASSRMESHQQLNSSLQVESAQRKAAIESEASSRMESHQQLNSSLQSESTARKAGQQQLDSLLDAHSSRLLLLECRIFTCSSHGSCDSNLTACSCDQGFTGANCSECSPSFYGPNCLPCSATCEDHGRCDDGVAGTGKCNCDDGWNGGDCSSCSSGYFGASCEICPSCGVNGACVDGKAGSGVCLCTSGWSGSNCSSCSEGYFGSNCEPCSCGIHGSCSSGLSGSGCICDEGWVGSGCLNCADDFYGANCDACPSCTGNSVCDDGIAGNGTCVCDPGFASPACTVCMSGYFGSSCSSCPNCGAHGSCDDGIGGSGNCTCDAGWTGSLCDACVADYYGPSCTACPSCGANGACNSTISGDGTCICNEGATGTSCESCVADYYGASCAACPSCANGTCDDGSSGSGSCQCDAGWTGALCDACASGYYGSGCSQCPDCGDHGSCLDGLEGSGSCSCDAGWAGDNCTACQTSYYGSSCTACPSCGSNGNCADGLGGNGTCICDEGWSGSACDACAEGYYGSTCQPCGSCLDNAVCLDGLLGNGTCVCDSGWEGAFCNVSSASSPFSSPATVLSDPSGAAGNNLGVGGVTLSANGLAMAASSYAGRVGTANAGSVLVWERTTVSDDFGTPVKLTDPNGADYDNLGAGGPCLSSDALIVVAGSHSDDNQGSNAGSLLVWMRSDVGTSFGTITPEVLLDPSGSFKDYLGHGGATLSTDTLILAAAAYGTNLPGHPDDDDLGMDTGAVVVWERSATSEAFGSVTPYSFRVGSPQGGEELGYGGAFVSGNGLVLAVGAHGHDNGGLDTGVVYVWIRTTTGTRFDAVGNPTALEDVSPAQNDQVGIGGVALTYDGLILATGSPGDDEKGSEAGAILVWSRANAAASFSSSTVEKVLDPNGAGGYSLGYGGVSLSSDGLVLAAGAGGSNNLKGSVLIWTRSDTSVGFGTVTPLSLTDPAGASGDSLGSSGVALSSDGSMAAAGVPTSDVDGADSGAVAVFQ